MKNESTKVRRAPGRLAYDLVWVVLRVGVAVVPALLMPSWVTWIVSAWLVIGVLFLLYAAFSFSFVAACPCCGALVDGVSRRMDCVGYQCQACKRFIEQKDGELVPTPDDRKDVAPAFGVLLKDASLTLPDRCCACDGKATRTLEVSAGKSGPTLAMPHCDMHEGGARLRKTGDELQLTVRSFAYAREIAEKEGLELVGTNRDAEQPTRIPWLAGAGGVAVMVLFAIFAAKMGGGIVAGIMVSLGAMAVMKFVADAGFLLRKRMGLG